MAPAEIQRLFRSKLVGLHVILSMIKIMDKMVSSEAELWF